MKPSHTDINYQNPRDPSNPNRTIIPRMDWDYAPWHQWTFRHIREMTATSRVWRGSGPKREFTQQGGNLGKLMFDSKGQRITIAEHLERSATNAFLVLSQGEIVCEQYLNGTRAHDTHLLMSVTKSVVGTLAAILMEKGIIDRDAYVTTYLPELEDTAYSGARIYQLMNMTTGVKFGEDYFAEESEMVKLDQACGWKPQARDDWPKTMWELIKSLKTLEMPHGTEFRYRSIETDVLGYALERAANSPLAELISDEIWSKMGAEEDADLTVDHGGFALADGGLCCTLRDLGRFGQLLLDAYNHTDHPTIPHKFVRDLSKKATPNLGGNVLANGSYHDTFWIEDVESPAFMCRGVFGQLVYVEPKTNLVVVKFSTWPNHNADELTSETLAAIHAINEHLSSA